MEVKSLEDLKSYISQKVIPLVKDQTAFLLTGDLGAGKTQFVKTLCEILKCSGVTSPTFSIINEYESSLGSIHHVDLYRLKNSDDIFGTGFWDIFNKKEGLIFIEWPQKINSAEIPKNWKIVEIHISHNNETRKITIKSH